MNDILKKQDTDLANKASSTKQAQGFQLEIVKNKRKDLIKDEFSPKKIIEKLSKNKQLKTAEIIEALLEKGHVTETELAKAFSNEYDLEMIHNLDEYEISKEVLELIPKKICEKNLILPLVKIDKTLVVVFMDPSNLSLRDNLLITTGYKIQPVVATQTALKQAFDRIFDNQEVIDNLVYDMSFDLVGFENELAIDLDKELRNKSNDSVVSFVNLMFSDAIRLKSSDIHIETYEKKFRIRYRIDGTLHEKHSLNKDMAAVIVSRIKVMSGMDISEKRKPQDARLKVLLGKTELNMRVNSMPTVNGEKIVLRILDNSALEVDMTKLGLAEFQKDLFEQHLAAPQGLILLTGPTGSGKTTTIYSGLMKLNTPQTNISTAEDPVEFRIHGINQVQMNPKSGLNFSSALRAFLRQDPDVILVGEIRDFETAEIAYKASATGHLVLSTVHTNDTASTVTRLLSMGVPSYNVADNTSLIVSQRLLRCLCPSCKIVAPPLYLKNLKDLGVFEEEIPSYEGNMYLRNQEGCNNCSQLGYKGRVAVYEMMEITKAVKIGIFDKLSPIALKRSSIENDNLITLRQSALLKLKQGFTSAEEVIKVTVDDL